MTVYEAMIIELFKSTDKTRRRVMYFNAVAEAIRLEVGAIKLAFKYLESRSYGAADYETPLQLAELKRAAAKLYELTKDMPVPGGNEIRADNESFKI